MLKHATISRTSRAQQTLQFQRHCQQQQQQQQLELVGRAQGPDLTLDSEATEQEQQRAHQQVDLFSDGRGDLHQDQVICDGGGGGGGIDDQSDASSTPNAFADQSTASMLFAPSSLLNPSQTKKLLHHREPSSCCSSPTPSNQIMANSMQFTTTAAGYNYYHSSAKSRSTPASLSNSPMKLTSRHNLHHHNHHHHHHQQSTRLAATPTSTISTTTTTTSSASKASSADSMIKIFAQTLSQDVEYITLHVNAQTKSQQIIKSLLKKFRLKHRDPNLFYLTLERWIRKDGLKFKSVMLLGDEASPLQLQQCCSNPPHNDIKFTLQMRTGALVKIYCSDVVPDAKYKCLSLSTQTTVDETIELMLHCLNLTSQNKNSNQSSTPTPTVNKSTNNNNNNTHHRNLTSSPNLCSGSCSSSASSSSSSDTSSSSGIESEPTSKQTTARSQVLQTGGALDSDSRASSVTSISSSSNISSLSSSLIDQYCMVIECIDSNFKRILHPDEYLVDVYQGLLAEASKTNSSNSDEHSSVVGGQIKCPPLTNHNSSASPPTAEPIKQNPDQWFFIKLKRRYEVKSNTNNENHHAAAISFVNPRQNVPLPPIPSSLFKHHHQQQQQHRANNNYNSLRHIVSTTQIEINSNGNGGGGASNTLGRPASRQAACSSDESELMREIMRSTPITVSQSQVGAKDCVDSSGYGGQSHAMPPSIILLTPPIRPRRRNLSNASSTFGRPLMANNRRRYDPAQLAEDLNRLNIVGVAPVAESE